jgi:hypothetical protein
MSNLRRKTIAAIAVTLLSLSVISVAQAGKDGKETSAAGMAAKKQQVPHKEIYNTTRTPFVVDRRQTGPATFSGTNLPPEFSPDYHGSNGG